MDVEPFRVVMLMVILGAGSDAATLLIFERSRSLLVESVLVDVVNVGLDSGREGLLRHTLAKWPSLPQLLQGRPNAGHLAQPPWCSLLPHPGQVAEWLGAV